MNATLSQPRLLNRAVLPLRLVNLLCAGSDDVLDVIGKPLYSSAMNQFHGAPQHARSAQGGSVEESSNGATLFRFLAVAEQLYARIAEALGMVGLSYAKYELLRYLHDSEEPISLGVLATGQGCARSNITQLVDRLESEGLVRRVDDPADRRGVRAELTPLGISRAEEGAAQIDRVRAEFADALTGPDRAELGRLLDRIV